MISLSGSFVTDHAISDFLYGYGPSLFVFNA
jgi:hypothetical protein